MVTRCSVHDVSDEPEGACESHSLCQLGRPSTSRSQRRSRFDHALDLAIQFIIGCWYPRRFSVRKLHYRACRVTCCTEFDVVVRCSMRVNTRGSRYLHWCKQPMASCTRDEAQCHRTGNAAERRLPRGKRHCWIATSCAGSARRLGHSRPARQTKTYRILRKCPGRLRG